MVAQWRPFDALRPAPSVAASATFAALGRGAVELIVIYIVVKHLELVADAFRPLTVALDVIVVDDDIVKSHRRARLRLRAERPRGGALASRCLDGSAPSAWSRSHDSAPGAPTYWDIAALPPVMAAAALEPRAQFGPAAATPKECMVAALLPVTPRVLRDHLLDSLRLASFRRRRSSLGPKKPLTAVGLALGWAGVDDFAPLRKTRCLGALCGRAWPWPRGALGAALAYWRGGARSQRPRPCWPRRAPTLSQGQSPPIGRCP